MSLMEAVATAWWLAVGVGLWAAWRWQRDRLVFLRRENLWLRERLAAELRKGAEGRGGLPTPEELQRAFDG